MRNRSVSCININQTISTRAVAGSPTAGVVRPNLAVAHKIHESLPFGDGPVHRGPISCSNRSSYFATWLAASTPPNKSRDAATNIDFIIMVSGTRCVSEQPHAAENMRKILYGAPFSVLDGSRGCDFGVLERSTKTCQKSHDASRR